MLASEKILAYKPIDHLKNNQDFIGDFPEAKITLGGVVTSVYLGTYVKIVFDGCRRYRLPLKVKSLFPPRIRQYAVESKNNIINNGIKICHSCLTCAPFSPQSGKDTRHLKYVLERLCHHYKFGPVYYS